MTEDEIAKQYVEETVAKIFADNPYLFGGTYAELSPDRDWLYQIAEDPKRMPAERLAALSVLYVQGQLRINTNNKE
jgi:hypothetical protein